MLCSSILSTFSLFFLLNCPTFILPPEKVVYLAQVLEVHDGDTIKAMAGGKETWIRLHGIDAPESGQPHGQAAMLALMKLTANRTIVVQPMHRDRYRCTAAMVFADGVHLNEAMVRLGYAWVHPRYCQKSFYADWRKHERKRRKRARDCGRTRIPYRRGTGKPNSFDFGSRLA